MIGSVILEIETQRSTIELAIAGDDVAFARIVAAYHNDMARITFFVCGDLDIAEEAEQSAWAVAARRLKDLRDPVRLRPWLMSVAANEARQIARSRRRRTVRELAIGGATRPRDIDHAALIDLADALGRLDPKDRAIVGLRFVGGFESAEIGRALGMSGSSVRVRLHRLLERLRKDLGDHPVRLILLDLSDERTLAVAIFTLEPSEPSTFAKQVAAAMPVIESFEFHRPTP